MNVRPVPLCQGAYLATISGSLSPFVGIWLNRESIQINSGLQGVLTATAELGNRRCFLKHAVRVFPCLTVKESCHTFKSDGNETRG